MESKTVIGKIRLRRDTAANWTVKNPILAIGELGYETDTRKGKVGDGNTTWNNLPYVWKTTVTTGSVNGTIAVDGTNVAVKGLGSAAYTASTAYAAASHSHSYLPLSGGTLTGVVNGVTPTTGDNSTKIATTEFVAKSIASYEKITDASNVHTSLQNSINSLSTGKQDKLTFDTTPTAGSSNPVTSDGIKKAIANAISAIVDGDSKSY